MSDNDSFSQNDPYRQRLQLRDQLQACIDQSREGHTEVLSMLIELYEEWLRNLRRNHPDTARLRSFMFEEILAGAIADLLTAHNWEAARNLPFPAVKRGTP